jgi:hypothetical protein
VDTAVLKRHGLYTAASLTGYLYGQSFQDFLIHLTTSLTLLAIANKARVMDEPPHAPKTLPVACPLL